MRWQRFSGAQRMRLKYGLVDEPVDELGDGTAVRAGLRIRAGIEGELVWTAGVDAAPVSLEVMVAGTGGSAEFALGSEAGWDGFARHSMASPQRLKPPSVFPEALSAAPCVLVGGLRSAGVARSWDPLAVVAEKISVPASVDRYAWLLVAVGRSG